jgi:hypothetical protein
VCAVADFVVLDPDQTHFFLQVSGLPDQVTEQELADFFQNRSACGGGPVSRIDIDPATKSARVFFVDPDSRCNYS